MTEAWAWGRGADGSVGRSNSPLRRPSRADERRAWRRSLPGEEIHAVLRPGVTGAATPSEGGPGRGTLAKEKPPDFGMIQRGGQLVIRMLEDVQQVTIGPLIKATIAPGAVVNTDE